MKKLLMSLIALSLPVAAAAQDREMGDENFPKSFQQLKDEQCKPRKGTGTAYRTNQVPGPAGPVTMSVTLRSHHCAKAVYNSHWLHGLRDGQGKLIVPEQYRNVHAVSPTAALVQRLDKSWALFEGGKERALPFPAQNVYATDRRGPCTRSIYGSVGTQGVLVNGAMVNGVRDVAYFYGSTEPAIFRNVPVPVRRVADRLYVSHSRGGESAVRVYDLYGLPVTGMIGAVSFWHPQDPKHSEKTCLMGLPATLAMGPSLDRDPSRPEVGNLWFPLSESGEFVDLPGGAIGVFSLETPFNNVGYVDLPDSQRDFFSRQWALVYPEADGWSYSLHSGELREVLARTSGGPRYRELKRDRASGLIASIDVRTGKWVVPYLDGGTPIGASAGDPVTAVANYTAARNAANQARDEALRREIAARQAKELAEYVARRDEWIRTGKLCMTAPPINRGLAEVTRYAQMCNGGFGPEDLTKAKDMGLAPDLLAKMLAGYQQVLRLDLQAKARREWERANPAPRPYYPGAFSDAIRNAGNAAVANINAGKESWFDDRRKAYREEWQRKQRAY